MPEATEQDLSRAGCFLNCLSEAGQDRAHRTLTSVRTDFFWDKPKEEKGDFFRLASGSPNHIA